MASIDVGRRRAAEKVFRARENYLEEQRKVDHFVNWEHRTTKQIEKRTLLDQTRRLKEKDEETLKVRREELKGLYESEMTQWREQVALSLHVSPEERMEQIRTKAYQLKEKRELERQSYVKQCYDRQWRDACDEARTLDSKAKLDKLMYDRKHALASKQSKFSEEDIKQRREYKKKLELLEQKEKSEMEARQRKNLEMKLSLDHQVKVLKQKNAALMQQTLTEERKQIEKWIEEEKMMKQETEKEARESYARGQDILKSNLERHHERERNEALQRERDLLLIHYAQEKERKEIEKELSMRDQGKEMTKDYVKFYRAQMIKDEKENSRIEATRNEAMEKIWDKRDEQLKAQAEARRKLMVEVNEGRQMQISNLKQQIENDKKEETLLALQNKEEWLRQEEAERSNRLKAKKETEQNMEANKRLMQLKLDEKQRMEQEKFLMTKQALYAEKQHKLRLSQQQGQVKTYFPLKHTNWYS